jgi:hypothetical protein
MYVVSENFVKFGRLEVSTANPLMNVSFLQMNI